MYPILIEWGAIVIPAWHAFFVLGAIGAYIFLVVMNRRHAICDDRDLGLLFATCYVAGYFGARLFSIVVEDFSITSIGDTLAALAKFGSMTFYGGFIAAAIVGVIVVVTKGLDGWKISDIAFPAGILALAIGRIGCFLNGDDYGIPVAESWWSVTFPNHPNPIPRAPVQLISTLACLTIVASVSLRFTSIQRHLGSGGVGFVTILSYALFRFTIEFIRADPRGSVFVPWISTSQFVSALVILTTTIVFVIRLRTKTSSQ